MKAKTFDASIYMRSVSWIIVLLTIILPILAFSVDFIGGKYPRLSQKLSTKILIGEVAGIVLAITIMPTLIVSWLKAAQGELEFSALGLNIKGPAAPIIYWVLIFVAVSAIVVTFLPFFRPELGFRGPPSP